MKKIVLIACILSLVSCIRKYELPIELAVYGDMNYV